MTREIVSFLVGQGGNQVGREFWRQLCSEHFLDGQGYSQFGTNLQQLLPYATAPVDSRDVYFASTWDHQDVERYVPRAILMDTEPSVLNKGLAHSFCRELFRYQNIYVHPENSSAGNNWFLGYDLVAMNQHVFNELFEMTQKELELADNLSGFQFMHSMAGGTGSGSGSAIMELLLHDHYPKKDIMTMSIFDDLSVPTVSTGTYNTTLTLARLIEHCQAVIPIDNAYFYNTMPQILSKMDLVETAPGVSGTSSLGGSRAGKTAIQAQKSQLSALSQEDINFLIAQMLCQATIPLRYPHLNSNSPVALPQLIQHSASTPRCHFFNINTIPIPHRLANLPSLRPPPSPDGATTDSTPHSSQPHIPDLEAARRAGITLPPSYIEKLTIAAQAAQTRAAGSSAGFAPWLQAQATRHQDVHAQLGAVLQSLENPLPFNYAVPPTFSAPPPVPLYRIGLVESYTSLFNPENRALHSPSAHPIPPGKYLNLAIYHSYNQQPASLPKALQYHHAKRRILDRFELNFIQNDPNGDQFEALSEQLAAMALAEAQTHPNSRFNSLNGHRDLQTNTPGSRFARGNQAHSYHHGDDVNVNADPSTRVATVLQQANTEHNYIPCHSFITPQMQILTQLMPHTDFSTQHHAQPHPNRPGGGGGSGSGSSSAGGIPQNLSNPTAKGMAHLHAGGMGGGMGAAKKNQPSFNFDAVVLVSNNTNIRHYLNRIIQHCTQLYNRGAWVNQYCEQSMYFNKNKYLKKPGPNANSNAKPSRASPPGATSKPIGSSIKLNHPADAVQASGAGEGGSAGPSQDQPVYSAYIEMERSINLVADVCQEYLYLEKHFATDPHKSFQTPFDPHQHHHSPQHPDYFDPDPQDPRRALLEPHNVQKFLALMQTTIKRAKPNLRSIARSMQPNLLASLPPQSSQTAQSQGSHHSTASTQSRQQSQHGPSTGAPHRSSHSSTGSSHHHHNLNHNHNQVPQPPTPVQTHPTSHTHRSSHPSGRAPAPASASPPQTDNQTESDPVTRSATPLTASRASSPLPEPTLGVDPPRARRSHQGYPPDHRQGQRGGGEQDQYDAYSNHYPGRGQNYDGADGHESQHDQEDHDELNTTAYHSAHNDYMLHHGQYDLDQIDAGAENDPDHSHLHDARSYNHYRPDGAFGPNTLHHEEQLDNGSMSEGGQGDLQLSQDTSATFPFAPPRPSNPFTAHPIITRATRHSTTTSVSHLPLPTFSNPPSPQDYSEILANNPNLDQKRFQPRSAQAQGQGLLPVPSPAVGARQSILGPRGLDASVTGAASPLPFPAMGLSGGSTDPLNRSGQFLIGPHGIRLAGAEGTGSHHLDNRFAVGQSQQDGDDFDEDRGHHGQQQPPFDYDAEEGGLEDGLADENSQPGRQSHFRQDHHYDDEDIQNRNQYHDQVDDEGYDDQQYDDQGHRFREDDGYGQRGFDAGAREDAYGHQGPPHSVQRGDTDDNHLYQDQDGQEDDFYQNDEQEGRFYGENGGQTEQHSSHFYETGDDDADIGQNGQFYQDNIRHSDPRHDISSFDLRNGDLDENDGLHAASHAPPAGSSPRFTAAQASDPMAHANANFLTSNQRLGGQFVPGKSSGSGRQTLNSLPHPAQMTGGYRPADRSSVGGPGTEIDDDDDDELL